MSRTTKDRLEDVRKLIESGRFGRAVVEVVTRKHDTMPESPRRYGRPTEWGGGDSER
jgi:hypothetical protein